MVRLQSPSNAVNSAACDDFVVAAILLITGDDASSGLMPRSELSDSVLAVPTGG
jgi:hypothetical protein